MLEMALELQLHQLNVYEDSQLIVNQLLAEYDVRKPDLIPYHSYAFQLLEQFKNITIEHVPRSENKQADALANLVTTLALLEK